MIEWVLILVTLNAFDQPLNTYSVPGFQNRSMCEVAYTELLKEGVRNTKHVCVVTKDQ